MITLEYVIKIMGSLKKCSFVVEVSPEYLKKNGASVSQMYDFSAFMDIKQCMANRIPFNGMKFLCRKNEY